MKTPALLLLAALLAVTPLQAQHTHHDAAHDAAAPLITKAPAIDGVIAPGEWQQATRYSDFVQQEPNENAPASERTDVFVARDATHLYLAFVAYDVDMAKVRADLTPRDRLTAAGDAVGVLIDPLHTGTRGYFFLFNPLGVQTDGIWTRQADLGWDGVLESRGRMLPDRYVVEVAIPLATIRSGGQAAADWDINFFRQIPRKNEESWWSPVPRTGARNVMGYAGRLTGMQDVQAGARLELIPTALAQATHRAAVPGTLEQTWGTTARLALSPVIHAEATYRPDFSFVESDEAQIAFNQRYALFYPEKRPFFLAAKDRFETPIGGDVSDPMQLVYTRAIAQPRYGARVLAEPTGAFVGAVFAAETTPDGVSDGSSSIVRAQLERPGGSQAGVLLTRREHGSGSNTVVAGDGQFRLPARVTLTWQGARSFTSAQRAGTAAYVDVAHDSRRGFQQVTYRRIDRDFNTELGFIPRNDVQQVLSHAGVWFRPQGRALLSVLPMMQHIISFDDAGRRVDVEYLPHVSLKFKRQTSLWLGERFGEEVYRGRRHRQDRMELRFATQPAPWFNLSTGAKLGRALRYDSDLSRADATFTGRFREANAALELRLGQATTVSLTSMWRSLGGNAVLPARELWLARVRAAYQFSPATYVRVIAQYDPDVAGTQASLLLGHELSYGTQFHLGLDNASEEPGSGRYHVFARVSYLFRR